MRTDTAVRPRRHVTGTARATVISGLALFAWVIAGAATTPVAASEEITRAFSSHTAGSEASVDHSVWTNLLQKYVRPGKDGINRVDYAAFKASGHEDLKSYVKALEAVDPLTLDRPEQFAYWANLYNAKTIDVVLDHYPVDSIRKISINEGLFGFLKKSVGAGGPWKAPIISVGGKKLSLDNVEHDIMRPVLKDPRIHYAVNCASYG